MAIDRAAILDQLAAIAARAMDPDAPGASLSAAVRALELIGREQGMFAAQTLTLGRLESWSDRDLDRLAQLLDTTRE